MKGKGSTYIRMDTTAKSRGYTDKTKITPKIYQITPFVAFCKYHKKKDHTIIMTITVTKIVSWYSIIAKREDKVTERVWDIPFRFRASRSPNISRKRVRM